MPSPPQPTTSTLSPAATLARWRAAPTPAGTPQATSAARSSGTSLSMTSDRGLVHHRALGKAADHAEGADVRAVRVAPAKRAVELRALRDARALGAQMMQAARAPAAAPAAGDEGEHDMVAGRDAGDGLAHRLDDAGRLVAEHHRRHGDAPLAAHDVQVGAAEADGLDLAPALRVARGASSVTVSTLSGAPTARNTAAFVIMGALWQGAGAGAMLCGRQFPVARERIRQIEAKAPRKLKHPST